MRVVLVEVIHVTLETWDGSMEYVRRTEMCTALHFVKLKCVCIGFKGNSVGDLKKFVQLNSSFKWRLFKCYFTVVW